MSMQTHTLHELLPVVTKLIQEQFPEWSHLPITPVMPGGMDNRTFRLGEDLVIRIPSAECYADQVEKEQKWLPLLSKHLSFRIPEPIAKGQPSDTYPWPWSIYRWIDGESANNASLDENELMHLATSLATFLIELHAIDISGAPMPGSHNFYRGASLEIYDQETRVAANKLSNIIDLRLVINTWDRAISSHWERQPVWIHGDLSAGNVLLQDKKLNAIIDFGLMSIGDPACDLTIAWTLLKNESRKKFKSTLNFDSQTWQRARGWALWKALITIMDNHENKVEINKQKQIINAVCSEV